MNPVPPYRPAPVSWWIRLLTRSPAEIEAERASRQSSPAPQPAGSRKGAIQPLQRTQTAPAVSLHHSAKRRLEHE